MLTSPGNTNSILITSARADDLQELLDEYRELSDNEDYEYLIDDIKNDIDTYESMTLGAVLSAQ